MFKIHLETRWRIHRADPPGTPLEEVAPLLALLACVDRRGSIGAAAEELKMSYRHAWGLLNEGEQRLGERLLDTQRGRGAQLTPLARALLHTDRQLAERLAPTLDALAGELSRAIVCGGEGEPRAVQAGPLRVHASHGFAVAALLEQLTAAGLPVALSYRTAGEALAALAARGCELAGFHVPLGPLQAPVVAHCAPFLDGHRHVLLQVAVRSVGLIVAAGNPLQLQGVEDLGRPGLRFVDRQPGSGTRLLVDLLRAQAGLPPPEAAGGPPRIGLTHAAVAARVAGGGADAGVALETAARRYGLGFVPLLRERYFLATTRTALAGPALQAVVQALRSAPYMEQVGALPGYDAADAGQVQSPAEAFGGDWPASPGASGGDTQPSITDEAHGAPAAGHR